MHRADGEFIQVVDHHPLRCDAGLADGIEAASGTGHLVPVRDVHQDRQVVLCRQLELAAESLVLGGSHRVVSHLADGDHPVLGQVSGQ